MPRKNLIRTNEHFYHITTRANNGDWFEIPMSEVWKISIEAFNKAQANNPAIVFQFVLMSNHYHLLIQTPNSDIDKFMFWFNRTFSNRLREESGRINRMFGTNYKWSLIKHHAYFKNVFRYIYQNPVRAKLVKRCEDYPYSTLHYTAKNMEVPFAHKPILHVESDLEFINDAFCEEKARIIKNALQNTTYKESRLRTASKR